MLVGTQMVAKGHDFPGVTLVGVLAADDGLDAAGLPRRRAHVPAADPGGGPRRPGDSPGLVIFQTYRPDHPLIQAAARHDYDAFAEPELLAPRGARLSAGAPAAADRGQRAAARRSPKRRPPSWRRRCGRVWPARGANCSGRRRRSSRGCRTATAGSCWSRGRLGAERKRWLAACARAAPGARAGGGGAAGHRSGRLVLRRRSPPGTSTAGLARNMKSTPPMAYGRIAHAGSDTPARERPPHDCLRRLRPPAARRASPSAPCCRAGFGPVGSGRGCAPPSRGAPTLDGGARAHRGATAGTGRPTTPGSTASRRSRRARICGLRAAARLRGDAQGAPGDCCRWRRTCPSSFDWRGATTA